MKKLILILLILGMAVCSHAGVTVMVVGGAAAACGITDSNTTGTNDAFLGYTGRGTCVYGSFTATSTYTLKNLIVSLKKGGSPTGTITVAICTDSTCGTKTDIGTIAESGLTTSYLEYDVSYGAGYSITDTVQYWIRLSLDRIESGSAITYVEYAAGGIGTEAVGESASESCTYSQIDPDAIIYYKASTCE